MKKISVFKASALCLVFVMFFNVSFVACSAKKLVKISEMTFEEISESIEIGEYKGCNIDTQGKSKDFAILQHIEANTRIKEYPEGTVEYYVDQLKKQYKYYAEQAGMKYEAMLDELGEDNFTMQAEAKRLVKQDMIFSFIQRKENITLSDEEKSTHFDRYVKKYSEKYNYEESYVREELSALVYESMLYDKTLEYLIINNTFIEDIVTDQ